MFLLGGCYIESLLGLASNIFICREEKDCCIWKRSGSRKFSIKSLCMALADPSVSQVPRALMWCVLTPPEDFCWLVIASKVSTVDNIRKKGMTSENIATCAHYVRGKGKTINHIFFHCKFASYLWYYFLKVCRLDLSILWLWSTYVEMYPFCDSVVYLERNER